MPNHASGLQIGRAIFHAYFIFDIADTIDFDKLKQSDAGKFKPKQLDLRAAASPSYIQFVIPPLETSLPDATVAGQVANVLLKLYDYGIVTVRLSFPFVGTWSSFSKITQSLRQSEDLFNCASGILKDVLPSILTAANKPHEHLVEDYFIFEVEKLDPQVDASTFLTDYRSELAALLLGESKQLTKLEQDEALRVHFSYFESDLAIVQWDASFVMDNPEGAEAVESILEFANTQLVEFRAYDKRLDSRLDEIYKWDLTRKRPHAFFGRRDAIQRTEQLRNLLVDIRELSDRASNALKIIGDAYYVRLYRGIASRLGLADWDKQVETKLVSVGEIYRFATDQAQHASSEFLELVIIILILIEIILSLVHWNP